jgi:hypothetical protein
VIRANGLIVYDLLYEVEGELSRFKDMRMAVLSLWLVWGAPTRSVIDVSQPVVVGGSITKVDPFLRGSGSCENTSGGNAAAELWFELHLARRSGEECALGIFMHANVLLSGKDIYPI